MVSTQRPTVLVGVTARRLAAGRVRGWTGAGIGERSSYLERVRAAGAIPVVLDPAVADDAAVASLCARLDAIVLTGGPDVDPQRYGVDAHDTVYGSDTIVDGFELAVARSALTERVPLLAICRGLQVLNVACGGTLHQHIPELPGVEAHGRPGEPGGERRHTVTLDATSHLASVMGTNAPTCSCHHHQSVDKLGAGLRVVGRASDGIVEALEPERPGDHAFTLAVQWHPEDTAASDAAQQRLFDALVEAGTPR